MSIKPIVAISSDFLSSYAKLPRQIQAKASDAINKFKNNPFLPGLNLEKIGNAKDGKIYSIRIDDAYRGIVAREEESNVFLILWVDHHDEAYAWAANKKIEVNKQTGALQVYEVKTETVVQKNVHASLFSGLTDEQLKELFVPADQIPFVREIADIMDFQAKKDSFAKDTYEALEWIANGFAYDEVVEMLNAEKLESEKATSFAEALEKDKTKQSFVVLEGEEELAAILSAPLEAWRVFLHPSQRAIVGKDFAGPARVTGGAGTGKTVVAMHRAKYLAAHCDRDEFVFFTTFTSNLAGDIRENLRKICTTNDMRHIEITNLDAWVGQHLRIAGFTYRIMYDDVSRLWKRALNESGENIDLGASFFQSEYEKVALSQESLTKEEYMKASRIGRGVRLDRMKRMQVWHVFEEFQRVLREEDVRDSETAIYECRKLIEKENKQALFRHIIVDEGQDFSTNAYRLIRQMAGKQRQNDLFIVGDAHQRIYGKKPVLSQCGIDVRGRSRILRINYRTTEETRRHAFALLKGIPFDALDGETETDEKCESLTHGSEPFVQCAKDGNEQFDLVLKQIHFLEGMGVEQKDICIAARTHKYTDDFVARLSEAGYRIYEIKRSKVDDRTFAGLRVATMHRVKGLEFPYVILIDCNDRVLPLASVMNVSDPLDKKEADISERCLLYVAMTRAQKRVFIFSSGKPSPYLQGQKS